MSGTGGGNRFIVPDQFVVDQTGTPYAGAQLFTYATGTNTPQPTYSNAALTVPNTNPIIADSAGRFGNVFLVGSPAYHMVLLDANSVAIWDFDPVGISVAVTASIPVGAMMDFGGSSAPAGWLLCFGQAVSRTTYAGLLAVIGTTYGSGDGSTTFNLPDRRGRASFGVDNMGGVAANRVTSGGSGISGITAGAVGGSQFTQTHNHAISDPGHDHALTDPGHYHQVLSGSGAQSGGTDSYSGSSTQPGNTAETGITIAAEATGITLAVFGSGSSQNMPPTLMNNVIIFTG